MADPQWSRRASGILRCLRTTALGLGIGALAAVDVSVPTDVPDDVGLGERLALIAWLNEHQVPVANPRDLPALRLAYLRLAHPDQLPPSSEPVSDDERGDAAAALYRKHGRNPPAGATAKEIRELTAALDGEVAARAAREQAQAADDELAHPSPVPPAPQERPAPVRTSQVAPSAPAAAGPPPDPKLSAFQQQREAARAAAGIVVGQGFPVLSGRTVGRADFDLTQWKGKVVLVDFWATWCGPCMREMPNVLAAYKRYHDRGFEVVGVSLDKDQAALQKMITELSIPWPQLCDWLGWESAFAKRYAVNSIPAAFLIGKEGGLLATDLRGPGLEAAIEKALGP